MADIVLRDVTMGIGNPNHVHFHRHNQLNLESQNVDLMIQEVNRGGLVESMINDIAGQSGGLTVQPRGAVEIEDTFNMRRGLCRLRFSVVVSALKETELIVLGYLAGGEARTDGIDPATRFVPVRTWSIDVTSVSDMTGMPDVRQTVNNSAQFLLGDPNTGKKLRSMRPIDIGNEVLGYISTEQEGRQAGYVGNATADLSNSLLVSKTQNMDSTHYAKQLLKIAGNVMHDDVAGGMGIEDSISGSIYSNAMSEQLVSDNEFFRAMAVATGTWHYKGFEGFTLGEIASVFENFVDVLDDRMLDANLFDEVDNVAMSSAYGATTITESTAKEIAFLCADLSIRSGLTHIVFAATNNVAEFGGFMEEEGVKLVTGEFMSISDQDPYAINRLERFKQLFKDKFYTKFNSGYEHQRNIVNIVVTCSLFGETSVELFFNGDEQTMQNYTNATYYICRTSPNIAGTEAGVNDAINFLNNLREYIN